VAYTSQSDLIDRYGVRMLELLTDRASPPAGAIDSAVVDAAIAGAGAMIDGYLASRYALPLASVPALIGEIAEAIAIWKLHPAAPDPKIEADYRTAMKLLADIASGTVRLQVAGVASEETGSTGARLTDRERPLTADNMKGFI